MSKAIIEKDDNGKEFAVVEARFNLSVIADERKLEDNRVVLGMGTYRMKNYYEQMIGVEEYPIKKDREGKIVGFTDDVEIIEQ